MSCCNENSYFFNIADVQYHIEKDGKYWYVSNTYDNCTDYLHMYCNSNKSFRTKENAIKYLKKCLIKYAKQVLKELI